jgi:release factor glutamine methyltransferase
MKKTLPESESCTVNEALMWAEGLLSDAHIRTPETDSSLLLAGILGVSRNTLHISAREALPPAKLDEYRKAVNKRAGRIPLDYILGWCMFMGLKFSVNSSTLIPRPETEVLVESVSEAIGNREGLNVLDLGTGSGNIAVSIAVLSKSNLTAVEKDSEALKTACQNSRYHGVADRINFILGDMFLALNGSKRNYFDYIVSNPPYVSLSEYASVDEEVKKEPSGALLAGCDGMKYIDNIISEGPNFLKKKGKMFIEIGYNQKDMLEGRMKKAGFSNYRFIHDYNGIYRIAEVEP